MTNGYGSEIPPLKDHVIIYFLEKGASENLALNFFNHFNKRQWMNFRGDPLANWKVIAWEWILDQLILKQ